MQPETPRPTLANAVERELQLVVRVRAVTIVRTRALSRATVRERDALREHAFLEQRGPKASSRARRRRRSPA